MPIDDAPAASMTAGQDLGGPPPDEPVEVDHRETDLGTIAGVCDRGIRHRTNEDAMSVATVGTSMVAVVCDGVSSTPGSGPAARAGADASVAVLADAVAKAGAGRLPDGAMTAAAAAAQEAVLGVPTIDPLASPSCTLVMAVVIGDTVTVGWIGDSRAYLVGSGEALKLTADDTWAAEAARAGLIPESAVETDRRAHTLTRWLGADAEDLEPHTRTIVVEAPARLLVCSDGLWNYASDAMAIGAIAEDPGPEAPPIEVARHLTAFAIEAGGHDNITVVVADVPAGNTSEPS